MALLWAHDQIKSTDKLCWNAGRHAWIFICNCSTRRLNGHPWQHRVETGKDSPFFPPPYYDVAVTRWLPKWMKKQLLWLIDSVKQFLEKIEKNTVGRVQRQQGELWGTIKSGSISHTWHVHWKLCKKSSFILQEVSFLKGSWRQLPGWGLIFA